MNLSDYFSAYLPAVENELKLAVYQFVPDQFTEFRGMLTYHMGWEGEGAGPSAQGKRLRPLLVLLACEACGGEWKNALPAAAAVELLHNFSLIHDDVEDQGETRRGRLTAWAKWGEAHAINAGDLLFSVANAEMLRLQETTGDHTALEAMNLFQRTCIHLTAGQYLDMSYEKRETVLMEDYWPMIEGKTSALLACCAELGALCAGAKPSVREKLGEFAKNLGLAFQVQDDWLGIWGDSALTGKSNASDLVTGKKTLPVLYGLKHCPRFAERWGSRPVPPEEAASAAAVLRDEGAESYTLAESSRLTDTAMSALAEAALSNDAGKAVEALALNLVNRKA
ncbi:MAG: polyprenyl synthetase family protein [Chloroflexi bacterium]|nr:polyprenyl synthetase family protein [Chloroflexota bacterium]